MPPVILEVVDTSCNQTKWHCYAICGEHADTQRDRVPDCLECKKLRIYTTRTARNYIVLQAKRGFSAPQFIIEARGFKSAGLVGDRKYVYQYVKFRGFKT